MSPQTSSIPFLDLSRLHASLLDELRAAFDASVLSGNLVGAEASRSFEEAFAAAQGRAGGVGCGSGTDALLLALIGLGVGPGDEVIVPDMTFVATAEAVVRAGAIPVLADVDADTLLLTDAGVNAVRSNRTKAVVPVHLYGHVVSFDAMQRWRDGGLLVIEDAAQAHLATWQGRLVGDVGHAACFSFYPGKNLGALGDGGMVLSDDQTLLASARRLRDHGTVTRYVHEEIGLCSRLDGIQAATLGVKLPHLAGWNAARNAIAETYRSQLAASVPDLSLVPWDPGAVHHLFAVRIADGRRDAIRTVLEARGIGTGIHYPVPLSRQPALAPWTRPCPEAQKAAEELLSLPLDPLMTVEQAEFVADTLRQCAGQMHEGAMVPPSLGGL
jgi:dTDP-4-amino-4,6-dideoxygalactose transaminase